MASISSTRAYPKGTFEFHRFYTFSTKAERSQKLMAYMHVVCCRIMQTQAFRQQVTAEYLSFLSATYGSTFCPTS